MKKRILSKITFLLVIIFFITEANAQTWESISTPVSTNLILFDMSFPAGQSNIGYIGGSNYTYNGQGKILKTLDAGLTWGVLWESSVSGTGIMSVYFKTSLIGYAGTMDGDLMKTTDGGSTWAVSDIDTTLNQGEIRDLNFYDSNNGALITGWNGVYTTSDGGDTWSVASTNYLGGLDLCYGDQDNMYIVGFDQKIYKSTDGGDIWTFSYQGSQGLLNQWINLGVSFTDADNGAVSSEEGQVFFTSDGGDTWTINTITGQNGLMNDVLMIDENELYVCATPGEIFHTINGGVEWDSEFYSFPPSLYKVIILENGVGLSCGSGPSGGTIFRKLPTVIGIEDYQFNSWNLYPNPANSSLKLNFTVENEWVFHLSIINSLGKTMYSEELNVKSGENNKEVDISGLSEGNYIFLITKENEQIQSEKFQIIR